MKVYVNMRKPLRSSELGFGFTPSFRGFAPREYWKVKGSAKLCNYFGVCRVLLLACEGDFLSLQWHFGVTMGSLWITLGSLWGTMGRLWGQFAPLWGHFGRLWADLGAMWRSRFGVAFGCMSMTFVLFSATFRKYSFFQWKSMILCTYFLNLGCLGHHFGITLVPLTSSLGSICGHFG